MKYFALLGALLLCPVPLLASPATDASSTTGLWKIDGEVRGRPVKMMCDLTENDRKLSGTCSGATDGFVAHKIAGTVKAKKVELHFQTSIGGASITLIMNGLLNEDRSKISGGIDVEPMAVDGTFEAMRQAASDAPPLDTTPPTQPTNPPTPVTPAQAPQPASGTAALATGTWNLDADVSGTEVMLTCTLTQTDSKLAGSCNAAPQDKTPRSLVGDVTANGLGWHFDSEYQGQAITVTMQAALSSDGSKMTGTMSVAPLDADGTFTGLRQQPQTPAN